MTSDRAFQAVLTPREIEILEMIANGYSAREIAEHLSIAARTVERHAENIRLKLQARNRVHMVKRAIILGELKIGAQSDHAPAGAAIGMPVPRLSRVSGRVDAPVSDDVDKSSPAHAAPA